jgi:parvulin-like peptidyl-prolyl isomerase
MKQPALISLLFGILLFSSIPCFASEQKLPVIDGKETVATVNGEAISFDEFKNALGAIHQDAPEGKTPGKVDYAAPLKRLINTKLILFEAREMGLDELPEIRAAIEKYSKEMLINILLSEHVQDLKPDMEKVNEIYRENVKEYKVKSLNFDKEIDAKRFVEESEGGGKFDLLFEKYTKEGRAKGSTDEEYLKNNSLLPNVAKIISTMQAGSVSPVIQLSSGFAVIKLKDIRFPEDEDARERAIRTATIQARVASTRNYLEELKKKYVKTNEKLLNNLDFESGGPGFDSLLKDDRIIAEVQGVEPITVGMLSKKLKSKFFHGLERAIENKMVNKEKIPAFEEMLMQSVYEKEALKQGIDKKNLYKAMVEEYENSIIFNLFIRKTITPSVKLSNDELQQYYDDHNDEFSYPEVMRITSIAFKDRKSAEKAMQKLRKGTAFSWLLINAEGQVDEKDMDHLHYDGKPLVTSSLPEDMREAVRGAQRGDAIIHQSTDEIYYVLFIQEVSPPNTKPFESVRKEIARDMFNRKIVKEVEAYAERLKEFYEVKIFLHDKER